VLGEFPDISDDSLILPKWIEAAQKRTIKRNGRPVLAWDIARYGEDESVGMRREGGWVRVYRAHHKADTMTTTGPIVKAHRDIHAEKGLNDFPTHVVDVVGVGAGVYDRLVELSIPVVPYNGGEAPFDKERFVNARAEDYWFEAGTPDLMTKAWWPTPWRW
jgi:phage terminase large subunit